MPVYIAETTPKDSRGMLGSLIGPALNVGLIVAYLTNIGFARFSVGWRISLAILGVISLIFGIGMTFLPHSPRYNILPLLSTLTKA